MTRWYAFVLVSGDSLGGHVREVEVIHEEHGGEAVVRYPDSGRIGTVGGPFCGGRLCDSEAEAWHHCAASLRQAAARLDAEASKCAAKAAIEVAA